MYLSPRGIQNYKVYDTVQTIRKQELLVGIVGIDEDIKKMKGWLKRCEGFIPAKPQGKQKGLFKSFPGFNLSQGFCAKLLYDDTNYERSLSLNDIKKVLREETFENVNNRQSHPPYYAFTCGIINQSIKLHVYT